MVSIFCSHSSKDASWIAPLKDVVEAMGHSMYLFEDDQRPGEYVAQKLQSEIKKSDIMMVFLTPNSEKSNYVHQEIGYAIRDNKPIVPLVEVGISSKVLGMLEGREYISFDRSSNPDVPSPEVYTALLGYLHKYDMGKMVERIMIALLLALLCFGVIYLMTHESGSPPGLFTPNT